MVKTPGIDAGIKEYYNTLATCDSQAVALTMQALRSDRMQMETFDHRTISEADARAIAELLGRHLAEAGAHRRNAHGRHTEPMEELQRAGESNTRDRSVSRGRPRHRPCPGRPATIRTSAGDMTVLALCRVCTDPAVRGKKLGRPSSKRRSSWSMTARIRFRCFKRANEVRPFYEKLGAITVDNRFFNSQAADPAANPFWDPVIMRYPATGNWPAGEIDTNGPGW